MTEKLEHKTLEEYLADIRSWDWEFVKSEALGNRQEPESELDPAYGTTFIGTVFALAPSGKYYMPWTSNQTEDDIDEDGKFYEALDTVAEEHGMFIENGEGDPCDLFASIVIEEE